MYLYSPLRYPRMKISLVGGLSHLGLMHLVATNLVLWMRTVIRESVSYTHLTLPTILLV